MNPIELNRALRQLCLGGMAGVLEIRLRGFHPRAESRNKCRRGTGRRSKRKLAEGKYKGPFMRGTPGRPPGPSTLAVNIRKLEPELNALGVVREERVRQVRRLPRIPGLHEVTTSPSRPESFTKNDLHISVRKHPDRRALASLE